MVPTRLTNLWRASRSSKFTLTHSFTVTTPRIRIQRLQNYQLGQLVTLPSTVQGRSLIAAASINMPIRPLQHSRIESQDHCRITKREGQFCSRCRSARPCLHVSLASYQWQWDDHKRCQMIGRTESLSFSTSSRRVRPAREGKITAVGDRREGVCQT